ncbi:MAG: hypothetical protein ABR508_09825 [Candidatus Baltobacteraceae bacterium]
MRALTFALLAVAFGVPVGARAAVPSQFLGSVAVPRVTQPPALSVPLGVAWQNAAKVSITYDAKTRQLDLHPTVAYLETAGVDLYVAFVVTQKAPITAQQRQNDAGLGTDDAVIVYLYPDGPTGFEYAFAVNPLGTHVAFSTENTAFSPSWQSAAEVGNGGYTVFMRIPLNTMKGGRSGVWRANLRRFVSATLDDYDWSYNAQTAAGNDPPAIVAGTMSGLPLTSAVRPRPRVGIYGLGEAASAAIGGSTSRAGLDLSVPITQTSTLVSTVHPDYSNVEIDQATISPTAFPRYFQDVRPFFAQLQNYYSNVACFSCTGVTPLYTTAIPTPRFGNAVEGKQGAFAFSAFDAVGYARSDSAQVVSYQTTDQKSNVSLQRVAVSLPGLNDDSLLESAAYNSQRGFAAEAITSQERGTLVADPGAASWNQYGIGTYSKTAWAYASWQRIGAQYSPIDGFVPNNGIAGYSLNVGDTFYRGSTALVPRVLFYAQDDDFRKPDGTLGQADHQLALGADLQHLFGLSQLIHIRAQVGSSFVQLPDRAIVSASQNGIDFTYGYRTATPQLISYYTGRFGPGTLDYWSRQFNLRLARPLTFSVEADDGDQRLDDGTRNKQWLERASLVWQQRKDESLSFGVRRIIGVSPVLEHGQLPAPYMSAWNLSAAFYRRWPHDEFYAVYGDPSRLSTYPGFIIKFIHYVGAEKGV